MLKTFAAWLKIRYMYKIEFLRERMDGPCWMAQIVLQAL